MRCWCPYNQREHPELDRRLQEEKGRLSTQEPQEDNVQPESERLRITTVQVHKAKSEGIELDFLERLAPKSSQT